MAAVQGQDKRLVFGNAVAATVPEFRNGAAGMHGKVQDLLSRRQVMACSIAEERVTVGENEVKEDVNLTAPR